jgi:hypothetical protein
MNANWIAAVFMTGLLPASWGQDLETTERRIKELDSDDPQIRGAAFEELVALQVEGEKELEGAVQVEPAGVRKRNERLEPLLAGFLEKHPAEIVGRYSKKHPVLLVESRIARQDSAKAIRLIGPSESASFGDDGGFVEWAPDPALHGKSGRSLGGKRTRALSDAEIAFEMAHSSKVWRLFLCPAGASELLQTCDGKSTLGTILTGRADERQREILSSLLVLERYGLLRWSPKKVRDGDNALCVALRKIKPVAPPPEGALLSRIYSCFINE